MLIRLPHITKFVVGMFILTALLVSLTGSVAGDDLRCVTGDDRINNRPPRDCGAPVLIYLIGDNIVVLTPSQGTDVGKPIMSIDKRTPIPTNSNTVIGEGTNQLSGRPVIISRLTTGEYQLNTFYPDGTSYIVVWYTGKEDLYHIDPKTGTPLDGAQPIIAPDAVNPSGGAVSAATTTTASTTPTTAVVAGSESLRNCRVTTTRAVRIRTEPNTTTSTVISTLPWRTTYQATDRIEGWYKVVYLNMQGWVSADFLSGTGCD